MLPAAVAKQFGAADSCGTRLMLPDDPRCFAAAPRPVGDGMPPLPDAGGAAQAASVRPPPPPGRASAPAPSSGAATPSAPHSRTPAAAAAAAAPYIGIVAITAAGTAAAAVALRRRVASALRDGRTEDSLLTEALLGPPLLR
jgi:hypothetical protein